MSKRSKQERDRRYSASSAAQEIFKGKDLILARPDGMTTEEYRILRRIQTNVLKTLFNKGHSPLRRVAHMMPLRQDYNYHPKVNLKPVEIERQETKVATRPKTVTAPLRRTITQRKTG